MQDQAKPSSDDGEFVDMDEEDAGVVETDDGGALVQLDEIEDEQEVAEHFANLADILDEDVVNRLGNDLLDLIEEDIESREERDKIYAEGLRRTGLGGEAPGGATFTGASKVVHPLLVEVSIDFAARVMKELFPAAGPVKQHIPGTVTKDKVEKSKRKAAFMNWQITKQIKEFRSELEQTLTQTPLGGAAYMKVFYDGRHKRSGVEFVAIDDIIYPFAASSFMSAERKTHRRKLTSLAYKRKVKDGIYLDVDLVSPEEGEQTASAKASDKIEGRKSDAINSDGVRTIYETSCFLDIETEGEFDPYLITIDETSRRVMSIYRNWEPEDEAKEELQHLVEFPFVPWRGSAPIGVTHMIGSLSGAATGALRALLDSAHIATTPSAFKLKGGTKGGQKLNPKPTEIAEVEGSVGNDDIRKLILPMPFNPPSPVLFQLLGFLIEQGRGVVRTTFEGLADQKTDMPVGTTLALIEQGLTVFSAIHSRLHNSMQQVLEIIHRHNATYLKTEDIKEDLGEILAKPDDFKGPMDVIPVSDPNIFSEVQRQAQIALIAQRAAATAPLNLYNVHRVERMILEYAKIPAPEELLNPVPEPERENAVNENVKVTMGKPLVVYPEQDHEAHITTHLAYMLHPMFGANPAIMPGITQSMVSHLRDHLAMWYVNAVVELASKTAGVDVTKLMDREDAEVGKSFDRAMAAASGGILEMASENQTLGALPPVIAKAMEYIKSVQPPTPMDPSAVAAQEVQRKAAADQQKGQLDQAKLAADQAKMQAQQQSDAQKVQLEQMKLQLAERDAMLRESAAKLKEYETTQRLSLEAQKAQQSAAAQAQQLATEQRKIEQDAQVAQFGEQSEDRRTASEIAAKVAMNTSDNNTALRIAAAEISSGEKVAVSSGTGIDP